jgi:iron complex outermembrane receptor protein
MDSAQAHLMRYDDPPSFDVGFQYTLGDFTAMAGLRQGKYTEPFSAGGANTGEAYNYDDYGAWNGTGPGFLSRSSHVNLTWQKNFAEHFAFESSVYFDTNETQQHLINDPSSQLHSLIGWSETAFGNISQFTATYDASWLGTGNWVIGGQIDSMNLDDSQWITGDQGEWKVVSDSQESPTLPQGSETIYSGFTQLKHKFNDQIIYNIGVRYDLKDRLRGENVSAISPRTAFILGADAPVGVKFSFSESFVDAAYWYRYNSVPNFRGTADLSPERMRAFQLSPTVRLLDGKLQNTVNFYYANHFDVIFRNKEALNTPEEPLYQNSGELTVAGIENEFAYLERNWRLRANFAYQRPLYSENYPASDDLGEIHNVPKFSGNLILDFKPLTNITEDLWLSVSGRYYSEQLSPIQIRYIIPQGRHGSIEVDYNEPNRVVEDYVLLNSSVRWNDILESDFGLQFSVNNVLNTRYLQGGTTSHPIPQPGRWVLLQLGYDLDL